MLIISNLLLTLGLMKKINYLFQETYKLVHKRLW